MPPAGTNNSNANNEAKKTASDSTLSLSLRKIYRIELNNASIWVGSMSLGIARAAARARPIPAKEFSIRLKVCRDLLRSDAKLFLICLDEPWGVSPCSSISLGCRDLGGSWGVHMVCLCAVCGMRADGMWFIENIHIFTKIWKIWQNGKFWIEKWAIYKKENLRFRIKKIWILAPKCFNRF